MPREPQQCDATISDQAKLIAHLLAMSPAERQDWLDFTRARYCKESNNAQ
jgi:hypothetical protein